MLSIYLVTNWNQFLFPQSRIHWYCFPYLFTKHWNQRRAEDSKSTTVSGSNLSTVGVDIGTFQIGKGVSLSTWDFGGQVKLF